MHPASSSSRLNPRSSNACVDSEDDLDGDEGRVGGVSGLMAWTVRYPPVSGHIVAASLRLLARRRKAKRRQNAPKPNRAPPMVMARIASAGSGRPDGAEFAVCLESDEELELDETLLGSTDGVFVCDPQHGLTTIVKILLVMSAVGAAVIAAVGSRRSGFDVNRDLSLSTPCIVGFPWHWDRRKRTNSGQPPRADAGRSISESMASRAA
jgi:hypothetical protein